MERAIKFCIICCPLAIGISLGIACIVLGVTSPGQCDMTDEMGLDVGDYLLGLGIFSLVVMVITAGFSGVIVLGGDRFATVASMLLCCLAFLSVLFGIAWFIVGAVILFRSNIECIRVGSSHIIFALVLWCMSAFHILQSCSNARKKSDN